MNPKRLLAASLLSLAAGCGSSEKKPDPEPTPPVNTTSRDLADIQVLEDTRAAGAKVEPFLRSADAVVRRRAALAIGRIGDAKSIDAVAALLGDPDTKVAEEAAFALGLIADPAIAEPLRRALKSPEPEVRALAIQALSRLQRPGDLGLAAGMVRDQSQRVRGEVGMAVARMAEKAESTDNKSKVHDAVLALKPLLHDPDAAVRWRTCFALARVDASPLRAELDAATVDQDALVRAFATRALGKLENPPEASLIRSAGDSDPRVSWEGVNALEKCTSGDVSKALNQAASGGESVTIARALEILGKRGEATPGTLKAALRHPSVTVRGTALWAKGYGRGMEAFDESVAALKSADPIMRRAAVRALAAIGTPKCHEELGRVMLGTERALQVQLMAEVADHFKRFPTLAAEWDGYIRAGLDIPDAAVREAAVMALAGREKEIDWDAVLEKAYLASAGPGMVDPRMAVLSWFETAKRGRAVALEGTKDAVPAVRAQAAKTLAACGESADVAPAPPPGAIEATKLEDIGFSTIVKLETTRGVIRIRLLPGVAPAMTSAFLRLVKSGFYDGKTWHRVVPNFVIQGGDPKGDGTGDAGFTLRDEWSREAFDAGAVGMATSGKDTGSCQLFIMSAPAPHLEGRYTVFARLESGMDVVRAIEVGDKIVKAAVER